MHKTEAGHLLPDRRVDTSGSIDETVMSTRPAATDDERLARNEIIDLAEKMLDGSLSFFEGADGVDARRERVGGIAERDEDFVAFLTIVSETDHLPLQRSRSRWSEEALARLAPEYEITQDWASGFAPQACRNLILRFRPNA